MKSTTTPQRPLLSQLLTTLDLLHHYFPRRVQRSLQWMESNFLIENGVSLPAGNGYDNNTSSSFLPVADSEWAEGASNVEPIYIPSLSVASANPYEKYGEEEDGLHPADTKSFDSTNSSLSFSQLKPVDKRTFSSLCSCIYYKVSLSA